MATKRRKQAKGTGGGDGRAATAAAMRDQARAMLDEQTAALVGLLRDTESLTRQASLTEIEMANQRQVQARLAGELDELRTRQTSMEAETARLSAERDAAAKGCAEQERGNTALAGQIGGLGKAVDKLEKEALALTREREKLEQKRLRLEEDLVRLRKIRDDYLAGIARFRALREEMIA